MEVYKMVDTSELESYLNDKSASENDVVEIVGAGEIEQKEDPNTHRKYRILKLPVKCNNKELIYSPNTDAIDVLNDKYGTDTAKWVGKKFQVKFYPKTAFGVTKTAILPVIIESKV